MNDKAIGVFDSGVGGLTVYRALKKLLPRERFIYLGDTARLPYGTKSPATVARYALAVADRLAGEGIKFLVVACNTASALALPALRQERPFLPSMGVIVPGGAAAAQASRTGHIAVLATEGTVLSGAYGKAIRAVRPGAQVTGLACNLLVSMAEEGWCEGPEADAVVGRYLAQLAPESFDTLVLGCTHFPILEPVIRRHLPEGKVVVDSALATAKAVQGALASLGLARKTFSLLPDRFLVTDGAARFERLAAIFLGDVFQGEVEEVGLDLQIEKEPDLAPLAVGRSGSSFG